VHSGKDRRISPASKRVTMTQIVNSFRDQANARKGKKKNGRAHAYGCGPVITYTPDTFYDSRPWLDIRYQALMKHGAKCQCCGRSRHDGVTIHVDHIKSRSKYPHLELSLDNLQVLCNECNVGKSNRDETDWR
jgi:hypothetical protein